MTDDTEHDDGATAQTDIEPEDAEIFQVDIEEETTGADEAGIEAEDASTDEADIDRAGAETDDGDAPDAEDPRATDATGIDVRGALEALLFVSDEPVSAIRLAEILEIPAGDVDTALAELAEDYREQERGFQLREVAGGWRLYSHPAYHELIEKYILSWDTRRLSQAALEVLSVIAYRQPVTRNGVNTIRGVNSEGVISSLIEKGLVRETGHEPGPGNAILYGTTRTFLEKFGLKDIDELPDLEEFAPDAAAKQMIRERLTAGPLASAFDTEEDLEDDVADGGSAEEDMGFSPDEDDGDITAEGNADDLQ